MEELYKLIEDYLNNALPEAQRREVERRIASDEDFQREVALHHAMQEEFGDPRGWLLYATMSEIMQEEPLPGDFPPEGKTDNPSGNRWYWWWVVPVALVVVAGIWYFNRSVEPKDSQPPVQEPPVKSLPPVTQPIAAERDSQPAKNGGRRLLAKADPMDFVPNAAMEVYIESKTLGPDEISVQVTSPPNAATFYPDKIGQTKLRFAGTFAGLPPREKITFNLLIFDNKNDSKPLMSISVPVSADAAGATGFDLQKKAAFRLGLYYYQIEEKESGEVLVTRKIYIGKLQ